jgi:carnitine-CoA ligase
MTAKHEFALRTLPAMLAANAAAKPEKRFLTDEAGSLTRAQMWELAQGMAGAFAGLGVEHGDPVVIVLDNRREFFATWFGLATLGAIEVPMNQINIGDRLVHTFNHSGAEIAVVQGEYIANIDASADRLTTLKRIIVVGEGTSKHFETIRFADLHLDSSKVSANEVRLSDPVAIMYTSGSTGPAKGAILPHGQHYTNGWQAVTRAGITEDDVVFICLPMHHNMAQGYGVWPTIVAGAELHMISKFDRAAFWQQVRAANATVLPFVGAMLVLLAKQGEGPKENPLRVAFGVPVPADLHAEFEERFGLRLIHGYGSTEATIVAWGANGPDRIPGSCGQIIDEFEVRLHDADDRPVAQGEVGEICIRPREPFSMFLGYHLDLEKTKKAFRNLWFHSGDRARFDEHGNLWFAGRSDDVIRRMGEFITATEVEDAIGSHPAVELAVAYGVPSELVDEEVMVAVVLKPGESATATEIREWCGERTPRFAVPRYIEFMTELPMTATGKAEKYKLRSRGVTDATDDARKATKGS